MSAAAPSAHVCTPSLQGGILIIPRAPHCPAGEFSHQRRYGPDYHAAYALRLAKTRDGEGGEVEVCRMADENTAGVKIVTGRRRSASIEVDLLPEELIELAARLIDAAHDIQANPAKGLLASMARARGAA